MSIVAGTRAPIEAVKYFREAAKPKQVFPPDPPMRMPSTSVAMLRRRAKAELAQQGGFPPSETIPPSPRRLASLWQRKDNMSALH